MHKIIEEIHRLSPIDSIKIEKRPHQVRVCLKEDVNQRGFMQRLREALKGKKYIFKPGSGRHLSTAEKKGEIVVGFSHPNVSDIIIWKKKGTVAEPMNLTTQEKTKVKATAKKLAQQKGTGVSMRHDPTMRWEKGPDRLF